MYITHYIQMFPYLLDALFHHISDFLSFLFFLSKEQFIESSLLRKIMFIKIFKSKFSWYIFNHKVKKKRRSKLILKNHIQLMHSSMSYNHLCTFNVQHHIKSSLAQIKVCFQFKNIYQARF